MNRWHFSFFRILFGTYLAIHFFDLVNFAPELWSAAGNLPDPRILPTWGFFPNVLFWLTSPQFVRGFVWMLCVASLLFAAGFARRLTALLLWYGWACLLGRNPFIANPGIPFVGLLLLFCVVIPPGEPLSFHKKNDAAHWKMPGGLYAGAWVLMALGYTISGLHKCLSPSWIDGSAIPHLLENPLARDTPLREWLLAAPQPLLRINTWGALALEILFAPLCLFGSTRKWVWLAMMGMHAGILCLVDFADLTVGVLMIHLFTFDERWLPPRRSVQAPVLFFDGVCGLCNHFVQVLFEIDQGQVFKVATLQGEFAAVTIDESHRRDLDSLVVSTSEGKVLTRSRAVLYIFNRVGGIWRVLHWLTIWIPAAISDRVYDFIAANRYRWFGKLDTCRLPTPEERTRFL